MKTKEKVQEKGAGWLAVWDVQMVIHWGIWAGSVILVILFSYCEFTMCYSFDTNIATHS